MKKLLLPLVAILLVGAGCASPSGQENRVPSPTPRTPNAAYSDTEVSAAHQRLQAANLELTTILQASAGLLGGQRTQSYSKQAAQITLESSVDLVAAANKFETLVEEV